MSRPGPAAPLPDPTRLMTTGWHCLHAYFRVEPQAAALLRSAQSRPAIDKACELLNPASPNAPQRLLSFAVSGHRADLGLMMLDPDPLKLDLLVHELVRTLTVPGGTSVLTPTYSFVSITEISEYVPTIEQYGERLKMEGTSTEDPAFAVKLKAYEQRLPMMNKQRLSPDIPDWPITCFYPMNKIRHPHANWYTESFSRLSALMAEHATSGIKFAGKVSQLITASTGFDDWEWGVTLWGRTPEYIKEIVYTMRFDEASARYAGFGPFYIGYNMPALDLFRHCQLVD